MRLKQILIAINQLANAISAAYIPPAPEPVQVPQVVTIRQAKLALLQAGDRDALLNWILPTLVVVSVALLSMHW